MSAEATVPDAAIPAQAGTHSDAPTYRHSRESGNPVAFARYPKYKDSGVAMLGEVPSHWVVLGLKRIAAIDNSGCYGDDPESAGTVLPVATTAQISVDGRFDVEQMPRRVFSNDEVERYGCRDGDILVVKSSGSAANIISGKAGLVDSQTPQFVFSNFLMRVQADASRALPKFVYFLLTSRLTRERIQLMCSTTTYPNLDIGEYSSSKLPIPPLDEQVSILAFLDRETAKIDALIAEQEKLIALLKEKRQALISHAVTKGLDPNAPMKDSGIEWLGQVPAHWDATTVRRIALRVDTGGTPAGVAPSEQIDNPISWFTPGDFTGPVNLAGSARAIPRSLMMNGEAKSFPPGSALIVSIGATLGKVGYATSECSANQQINAVIPKNRLDGHFLTYSLIAQADQMRFLSNASTIGIMNQEKTKEIAIAVPPREEQAEICGFLDGKLAQLESLECTIGNTVDLLKERRAALISAAVTGKIDVRDKAASNKQDESRAIAGLMGHGA